MNKQQVSQQKKKEYSIARRITNMLLENQAQGCTPVQPAKHAKLQH